MKINRNRLSCTTQVILWIIGINIHNTYRDECTPDFSCCTDIRTPFVDRLRSAKRLIKTSVTGKYYLQ